MKETLIEARWLIPMLIVTVLLILDVLKWDGKKDSSLWE